MKKSLSLLLTFALVFGLFANMASAAETPASAGKYLFDNKIVQGNGTDLLVNDTWKRQDLAVLLSRLMGVEAAAKATAKSHTYKDVRGTFYDGYLSWAREKGYLEGASATSFGFDQLLNNQSFYAVVLRAVGVDTTGEKYKDVPELAVAAGIAPADTNWSAAAKRGETYVAIYTALGTVVGDTGRTLGEILGLPGFEVTAATAISSVTATGAKKLTVTFNGTVDTAKAKISVFNGTNPVNSKSITFSDDKKSAVVEFANNLAEAEYTVKVEDVAATVLEAKVKVEAEKVTKIELVSDKAAIDRNNSKQVQVGYKVLNQYGENVTASNNVSATSGRGTAAADPAKGLVTVTSNSDFILNESVNVSLLHTNGTYVSAILTVSAVARVSSVKIEELYHADKKELVVGNSNASEFKLIVDLKDQYGASVTDVTYLNDDLLVIVGNTTVASLLDYGTVGGVANTAKYSTDTFNGTKKVFLTIASGLTQDGTSTIQVMSKTTGNKDTFDVVVKQNTKVDKLTISAPVSAAANSVVTIPFTAVDQFGKTIENPTNAMVNSMTISGGDISDANGYGFVKDHVKNVTELKAKMPATKGPVIVTIVTGTFKETAQITFNVTDAKVATVISGVKDLDKAILQGGSVTLGTGNVVIKDQYNGDFTITTWGTEYRVAVESSDTSKVELTPSTGPDAIANGTISTKLTGKAKGSSTITLKLQKIDGGVWKDVANSSYSYSEKVVDKSEITEYTATVDGKILAGGSTDYSKELKVKGALADGTSVSVTRDVYNYEVDASSLPATVHYTPADGKIAVDAGHTVDGTTKEDKFNIVVIIKGANQEIKVVEVTTSKAASKAETLAVSTRDGGIATKESDNVISVTQAALRANGLTTLINDAVETKDQYGVVIADAYTNYASNYSNSDRQTIATVNAGDTFNVAVVAGGKTLSLKVIVK